MGYYHQNVLFLAVMNRNNTAFVPLWFCDKELEWMKMAGTGYCSANTAREIRACNGCFGPKKCEMMWSSAQYADWRRRIEAHNQGIRAYVREVMEDVPWAEMCEVVHARFRSDMRSTHQTVGSMLHAGRAHFEDAYKSVVHWPLDPKKTD